MNHLLVWHFGVVGFSFTHLELFLGLIELPARLPDHAANVVDLCLSPHRWADCLVWRLAQRLASEECLHGLRLLVLAGIAISHARNGARQSVRSVDQALVVDLIRGLLQNILITGSLG